MTVGTFIGRTKYTLHLTRVAPLYHKYNYFTFPGLFFVFKRNLFPYTPHNPCLLKVTQVLLVQGIYLVLAEKELRRKR